MTVVGERLGDARLVGFARHLRVEVADDGVHLFSERGLRVVRGRGVTRLAPLLDGTRDLPALRREAPDGLGAAQVENIVRQLVAAGLVTLRRPGASGETGPAPAYWEAAGLDVTAAVAGMAGHTVGVLPVGDVDHGATAAALRSAGLTVTPAADAGLTVVVCDDYLRPELAEIDAAHRDREWLLAKPTGARLWLGPLFRPAEPGCWHCLADRLRGRRIAERCATGRDVPVAHPAAHIPPSAATAAHLIALATAKWLAGHRDDHQRDVWTFDTVTLAGTHHAFRARPQCPSCGDPTLVRARARRPVTLAAGGQRAPGPDDVLGRYGHLVSPVTGIVNEIRRDERGPAFFNSFRSGAAAAPAIGDLDSLRAVLRVENGGKGVTAEHARASALCEAIERYSGNFHGDEERVRGSRRSLGEAAIHPNACQLFDERQFADRASWNAAHSPFQHVTEPFREETVTDWTPVWSLTHGRHRLLPTGLLYYGAPVDAGGCLSADSNGSAAGASIEDAILHGLLEVVERDAVALWWYNRSVLPAVDLDAIADPWLAELRDVYAGLGREVWALDLTADLGVPTVAALSRRIDGPREDIMLGFGAHPDGGIAARRALTELNQLMPAVVDAPRTGRYGCDDPDAVRWWRTATVADQPYLRPDPHRPARIPANHPAARSADPVVRITALRRDIEARGMEVLVLDQTRPDVGLPVAKVLVPGMRHFWARLAPGRLFAIPVLLGRNPEPTPFRDMNPIPMFL